MERPGDLASPHTHGRPCCSARPHPLCLPSSAFLPAPELQSQMLKIPHILSHPWVTLGRLVNLFKPQFSHPHDGDSSPTCCVALRRR